MSLSVEQANSFSSAVQNAKANQRAQNNAVMDAFHQQVQETREANYLQGAQDTFKDLKSVKDFKGAVANNMDKYKKPEELGKKVASGVLGEETAGKLTKTAGMIGSAVSGGLDLYSDIKNHDIEGDNFAKKTENISNIVGGGLDVLSIVAPEIGVPLELAGATAGLVSAFSGAVGDVEDATATAQKQATDESSELTNLSAGVSLAQSGQLETGRTE